MMMVMVYAAYMEYMSLQAQSLLGMKARSVNSQVPQTTISKCDLYSWVNIILYQTPEGC